MRLTILAAGIISLMSPACGESKAQEIARLSTSMRDMCIRHNADFRQREPQVAASVSPEKVAQLCSCAADGVARSAREPGDVNQLIFDRQYTRCIYETAEAGPSIDMSAPH